MKSLNTGTSVFCFLSHDTTVFTSQCHEMSLWRNATWPTLLTQSRGSILKGECLMHLLPLEYCLFQLLVCGVVSRRLMPGLHPLYDNRRHLLAITSLSHQTAWWSARAWSLPLSELEDAPVHTVPLIRENMEQFIFPLYVTKFNWGESSLSFVLFWNSNQW